MQGVEVGKAMNIATGTTPEMLEARGRVLLRADRRAKRNEAARRRRAEDAVIVELWKVASAALFFGDTPQGKTMIAPTIMETARKIVKRVRR